MENKLSAMVKFIVFQQFYSEEDDVLYSRDKRIKMSIPGIRRVILAFLQSLEKPLDLISQNKYRLYLEKVSEDIPVPVEQIFDDFEKRIRELPKEQLSNELVVNFLVGPIRSHIQQESFDKCISDVLKRSIEKEAVRPESFYKERLSELYSMNDSTVSMLYNLAFLKKLAKIYNDDTVHSRVKKMVGSHCTELLEKVAQ